MLEAAGEADVALRQKEIPTYLEHGFNEIFHDRSKTVSGTVALCTATKNRLWQLKNALPLNLIHCWPYRQRVKIYVVDFDSTDGTMEWIVTNCRVAMDIGLLNVFHASDMPHWHASVGKNTAHMVACEDILVNLDGDNLVGPGFAHDVSRRMFHESARLLQYEKNDGTCGRIAYFREDFLKLRGYDEDAYPMGYQDIDLMERLEHMGGGKCVKVRNDVYCNAIPNSIEQKISACSREYGNVKWGQMNNVNTEVCRCRQLAGHWIRNVMSENIGIPAYPVIVESWDAASR